LPPLLAPPILCSRRHTLGFAWCRSGTNPSVIDRRIPVRSLAVDPPVGSLPHLHQVNSRIPGENQASRFPLSIDCVPFGSLFISLSLSLGFLIEKRGFFWVNLQLLVPLLVFSSRSLAIVTIVFLCLMKFKSCSF
ncbi:unnamed protein product, partial [Musa acuminata subsp. burmannicoides]